MSLKLVDGKRAHWEHCQLIQEVRMTRLRRFANAVIATSGFVLLPSLAGAGTVLNADNGVSERIFDTTGTIPRDQIGVVWVPTLNPETTLFGVTGSCKRISGSTGEFTGNHKAAFKKVTLLGGDTGIALRLPNFSSKIKNGLPKTVQVVDITSLVRSLAGQETVVVGLAEVVFKKAVNAGDYVQCFFAVVEGDAGLIPLSASAEEKQILLEEVARQTVFRGLSPEME